jgi:hypothetical protein
VGNESFCPWVRAKDYVETSVWVELENSIGHTRVGRQAGIELVEMEDKGVVLKMPERLCALGHLLSLRFGKRIMRHLEPADSAIFQETFRATAKVIESGLVERGWQLVTLKFYQYQEEDWKKFTAEYSNRQSEMSRRLRLLQE